LPNQVNKKDYKHLEGFVEIKALLIF